MGIKDLSKLIADAAPFAIKENEIKNYFGRKVAIDASMSLYQFLIAVRSDGAQLTNADGETTSHLMGTFYRVSDVKCLTRPRSLFNKILVAFFLCLFIFFDLKSVGRLQSRFLIK